ncbi:MAG: Rrf2 family transcriptional regulator [Patescibacteria group bacterium]|jgi:Rrf2 family protein
MKFSTRAEYGLKAIINLANAYPEQKSISEIGKEENISLKYLERLMGEFRKNNLVKSTKGKTGGYALVKRPSQVAVGEVIEIIEGSISPMKCVGVACSLKHKCPSAKVWEKLGGQIRKTLYGIKLNTLIK